MILGCNITMEEYGQVQRENGRREDLEEGMNKLLTAAGKLKDFGMTTDEIVDLTGLTREQIESL